MMRIALRYGEQSGPGVCCLQAVLSAYVRGVAPHAGGGYMIWDRETSKAIRGAACALCPSVCDTYEGRIDADGNMRGWSSC